MPVSAYDPNGRLLTLTDPKGGATAYRYEPLNRPLKAEYGRSRQGQNLTPPDAIVDLTHDVGGRLTYIADTTREIKKKLARPDRVIAAGSGRHSATSRS